MRKLILSLAIAAAFVACAQNAQAQITLQFGTPNYGYGPNVYGQNAFVPYQYGQYYNGAPVISNYGGYPTYVNPGYNSYYTPQYSYPTYNYAYPTYNYAYPGNFNYNRSYYGQGWNAIPGAWRLR